MNIPVRHDPAPPKQPIGFGLPTVAKSKILLPIQRRTKATK